MVVVLAAVVSVMLAAVVPVVLALAMVGVAVSRTKLEVGALKKRESTCKSYSLCRPIWTN